MHRRLQPRLTGVELVMSTHHFTSEDKAFLTAILNQPAELTGWLAYADWLDERGQPVRAEYLRLLARVGQLGESGVERKEAESRLRELRAKIHPDWTAVFDRPIIENCNELFAFRCPRQWENLKVTGKSRERYCETCDKSVYYCSSIEVARAHARHGHCVAVSLDVRRRPGDLNLPVRTTTVGRLISYPETPPSPPPSPRRRWWKFW